MNNKNKVSRVRTTFTVNKAYWEELLNYIDRLKLRRDSFLNHVLWGEVKELEKARKNSTKAETFLKEERGHGVIWGIDGVELTKVNLSLDKDLLGEINRVCADKRISRDIFLEEYLRFLVHGASNGSCGSPLSVAVDMIEDPRSAYMSYGNELSAYDALSISDEEVDERENEWKEQQFAVEAIAQLRSLDLSSVSKALMRCTLEERSKIINSPDVQKKVEELRSKEGMDVDLQDLIDSG